MSNSPFYPEDIRRLIEFGESPTDRLLREIYNSPTIQLLREIDNTPAMQVARMLEQFDIESLSPAFAQVQRTLDALTQSEQWAGLSGALARIHADVDRPESIAAVQLIDQNLKTIALTANEAILPLTTDIQSYSETAARAVNPLQEHFTQVETWQSSLADRMNSLKMPWALEEHLGLSMVGFARIARLHDISIGASPFDPISSRILDGELGEPVPFDADAEPEDREAARIEAGLNPEIVAFPEDAYPAVLVSAGFDLRIEAIEPISSDDGDESGVLDPQHSSLISQIENRLRHLVETELRRLKGDRWQRRIHGDLRRKWQERKTKDHDQRGDSYPLLFYADFMDLSNVICQGDNWADAFERFFVSKQDFQVSMERLCPVRNAIGHNRPLVRADQVTLFSEAFRILRALGVLH